MVATWAAFGAHATMVGDPILHADWPGAALRTAYGEFAAELSKRREAIQAVLEP